MNRIKEVLEEKGIKQTWLAEKLEKSYNMVNSYVQNRRQPSIEDLHRIAEILDEDELPERDILLMLIEKCQKTIGVNLANCWDLHESIVTTIQHIDEYHFSHRKSLDIAVVNAARLLADISLASGEPVKFVDAIANQGVFNELVLSEAEIQQLDNKRESVRQMMQALVL